MRNKIFMTCLAVASFFGMSSCDNEKLIGEFLDEYDVILYFRNSGELQSTFYITGEDGQFQLIVNKAGSQKTASADVSIRTLDNVELKAYNESNGTNYEAIPEEYYSYDSEHLTFTASDYYKSVTVTLKTEQIGDLLATHKEANYVIPVQLYSGSDSINIEKQYAFIKTDVKTLTIGFENSGFIDRSLADDGNNTSEIGLNLTLPVENVWDLQCGVVVDESALAEYNQFNGTNYEILPADSYSLNTTVSFENGKTTAPVNIVVDKSRINYGTYILPLTIEQISKAEFKVDEERKTVLLAISFIPPSIALTADMLSTNAQEPSEGSLANLLDGHISTYFHSAWSVEVPDEHYVQVTLKGPIHDFVFSYTTRSSNGNAAPIELIVSVSNDGRTFKDMARFTNVKDKLPTEAASSWESPTIKSKEGCKYIRFTNVTNASGSKYFVWSEFSLSGK